MKLSYMKRFRIKQALDNLSLMEKNILNRNNGEFNPTIENCLYLIDCLLPVIDIYQINVLQKLSIESSFNNVGELENFLDDLTNRRFKSVENYEYSTEELDFIHTTNKVNVFDFIFINSMRSTNQLEFFLTKLYASLKQMETLFNDVQKKYSLAKISYLRRMTKPPLTQIASLLEAIAIGLANNEITQ